MIERTLVFEDFDGNEQTEVWSFHLGKADALRIAATEGTDFANHLKRIVASNDNKKILETFDKLISAAVGRRSEDGRKFIHTPEEFMGTAAYDQLIIELFEDQKFAGQFVSGMFPASMSKQIDEELKNKLSEFNPTGVRNLENIQLSSVDPFNSSSAVIPTQVSPPEIESRPREITDYTNVELMNLPQEDFNRLMKSQKHNIPKELLVIALNRTNIVRDAKNDSTSSS